MNDQTIARLRDLNSVFYADFAESFAQSRGKPQPGFARLLPHLPEPCEDVLDVGCGNGRFGSFLIDQGAQFNYVGVDFSAGLLAVAAANNPGHYLERDLTDPGALDGLGSFDLCVCLAAMQHIPAYANRVALLQAMAARLRPGGRIFLANWQFMDSLRQRRKVVGWEEVGLDPLLMEPGDYLLTWHRDGRGLRYVHQVGLAETLLLADAAGLQIIGQFRSDGREDNLSLYTILAAVN
jgi:SAM-dependent methyltransferase